MMFKKYYVRHTNLHFVSHNVARITHQGPYMLYEATKIALHHANKNLRDRHKSEVQVVHRRDLIDLAISVGR